MAKETEINAKKTLNFYKFDNNHYLLANVKEKPIPLGVFSARARKKDIDKELWELRKYIEIIQRNEEYFHLFDEEGIKYLKDKLNFEIKFHDIRHSRDKKTGKIVQIDNNYYIMGKLIFQDYAYLRILNWLTKIKIHKAKYNKLTIEGYTFIKNHYPNIKLLTNKEMEKERDVSNFFISDKVIILSIHDSDLNEINYTNLIWFDIAHLYFNNWLSIQVTSTDIGIEENKEKVKQKLENELINKKKDVDQKIDDIFSIVARAELKTDVIYSIKKPNALRFIGKYYKNVRIKSRQHRYIDILVEERNLDNLNKYHNDLKHSIKEIEIELANHLTEQEKKRLKKQKDDYEKILYYSIPFNIHDYILEKEYNKENFENFCQNRFL